MSEFQTDSSHQPELQALYSASSSHFRMYSDAERQASLQASMAHWRPGQDVWVYGYGSLVWRPGFDYAERRDALLRGYHRALCLWSHVNRGTPERPGLVFGLDAGGSCRGVVYRIASRDVPDVLDALWKREMPSGAYRPKWLTCHTPEGGVPALVFTMDRSKEAYAQGLSREQLVAVVRHASGTCGPCSEYVIETSLALKQAGIRDHKLEDLAEHLLRVSSGISHLATSSPAPEMDSSASADAATVKL